MRKPREDSIKRSREEEVRKALAPIAKVARASTQQANEATEPRERSPEP